MNVGHTVNELTEEVLATLRDAFYITVGLTTLGYREVRQRVDDLLPLDLDLLDLPTIDLPTIDLSTFDLPVIELPTIDLDAVRDSLRDLVSRAA